MQKRISIILVLLMFLCLPAFTFAETIVLKSGKTVEGNLIEKTEKYIKIDFQGVLLTYFLDEIQSVDGETLDLVKKEKVGIGRPPVGLKPAEIIIKKNDGDDFWEMTIEGIGPMYDDSDPRRGKGQKESDETILKPYIQQLGSREAVINEMVEAASAYFNAGYPNIAMKKFNQAWSLDPKNAVVYYGFGRILSSRREFDGARKMYTKAIELNSKYFEAYASRGLDYFKKEEFVKAILDLTQAIEIRPNENITYSNRAVIYFFQGEYDKAWLDVHKAEALGHVFEPGFLTDLKKASGRDK